MRYEYIELNLSTEACDALEKMLIADPRQGTYSPPCEAELLILTNELRARLQRTDQDPKATLPPENWIDA